MSNTHTKQHLRPNKKIAKISKPYKSPVNRPFKGSCYSPATKQCVRTHYCPGCKHAVRCYTGKKDCPCLKCLFCLSLAIQSKALNAGTDSSNSNFARYQAGVYKASHNHEPDDYSLKDQRSLLEFLVKKIDVELDEKSEADEQFEEINEYFLD